MWRLTKTIFAAPFYLLAIIGSLVTLLALLVLDKIYPNERVIVKFVQSCIGFKHRPIEMVIRDSGTISTAK